MERVADNFDEDLPKPSHGAAVFCRDPGACEALISPEFGAESCGMPMALLRLKASLCVVGVHVPPPVPVCATGVRPYVREIHSHIRDGRIVENWGPCRAGDPVLVAGDFNAVPGSWTLRTLADAGLEAGWDLRGVWGSTWPAGGGWPDFPVLRLDHALSGEVEVHSLGLRNLPGADHKALELWVD
jgi:endonuclease/exonuclease/phosphatase (EEP) superfamily protein YafD